MRLKTLLSIMSRTSLETGAIFERVQRSRVPELGLVNVDPDFVRYDNDRPSNLLIFSMFAFNQSDFVAVF